MASDLATQRAVAMTMHTSMFEEVSRARSGIEDLLRQEVIILSIDFASARGPRGAGNGIGGKTFRLGAAAKGGFTGAEFRDFYSTFWTCSRIFSSSVLAATTS